MDTTFQLGDGKEEWLTPPHILKVFPEFDLDPCAPEVRPWEMAKEHFTIRDNGLIRPWHGFCWVNPPYGRETKKWLGKLHSHAGGGIAMVFARTQTRMFFDEVWPKATAILFLYGSVTFWEQSCAVCKAGQSKHKPEYEKKHDHKWAPSGQFQKGDATAGAPSVLVAYGDEARGRLFECNLRGCFIDLHDADCRGGATKKQLEAQTPDLFE